MFKTLILLAAAIAASAQTQTTAAKQEQLPATELEAFLGAHGQMMLKDFYNVGVMHGSGTVEIQGLVISEPTKAGKVKGLRIEVTDFGATARSNTSFIDADELESLSRAIAYMSQAAEKWDFQAHGQYSEALYTSKGEFQIGFYENGKDAKAFCRSGTIGAATAYIRISDLPRMKGYVDQAIALLQAK
jgi:hypothetical protein